MVMQTENLKKEYSSYRINKTVMEVARARANQENRSVANYIETLILSDAQRTLDREMGSDKKSNSKIRSLDGKEYDIND